jgi:membrane fusion protein, heavy metal efflux system
VFVEQAPGSYRRTRVGVGPESDGHAAILDGLDAGQRVVTTGNLFLEQLLDSAQRS